MRRTSHVDMFFPESGDALELRGRARDLRTDDSGPVVIAEAAVEATVSPRLARRQRLVRLATDPPRAALAALVGAPVMSGFRRATRHALPAETGTTLALLLDELPVATLISGYATLRSAALEGVRLEAPGGLGVADRMSDMCSGWREDGVAITNMRSGAGMPVQDCPPAPSLSEDDPQSWHQQPRLPPKAMRRRRRIDVWASGQGWAVDAMFRDTYGEPKGHEGVLHEYTLRAWLTRDLVVAVITAEPRVLPFPECPWAADNVGRLVGQPVADLRSAVSPALGGIVGCTHLNDLLRSLADIPWLVGRLAA